MNNPLAKLYSWQVSSGQLDGWTSYHLAAGLFIAKVAQWLGSSDLWAVLWVLIIGVLWEIFEVWVEGTHETYGTKKKWAYNTAADIIVEVGAAAWMVWQERIMSDCPCTGCDCENDDQCWENECKCCDPMSIGH